MALELFPERLRAAREGRKLSQSELAQRAGLQPSAVSHFEAGRRAPSFDNLKRLANALDVTTDYLLGRTDEDGAPSRDSVGPTADRLFRHAREITLEDLETLADFAEVLAKRNRRRSGEDKDDGAVAKPGGSPRS